MKFYQTAVLMLIGTVLLLLAISPPLVAQKGVHVDPAPGHSGYVQYETLVVIYPNTVAGEIDGAQVEQVKAQVRQVSTFIWRNSGFRFYPHLTFLVLDEYVDGTEFFAHWGGCGWLYPNDVDGDGESPEADLLAAGVAPGQYDSINLLWAHNNGQITPCASGSTWPAGWEWETLGRTMLTTGILLTYGETITNPFFHELQHSIHGAMDLAGNEAYFDVDQPWMEAERFGGEWHYQAVMMRAWPRADWFDLLGIWGTYGEAPDGDGDGVPDSGDLPLTEEILGSSPAAADTDGDGVDDLQEALAGLFRAGDSQSDDSDGDGRPDATDQFPLYPLREEIGRRRHALNGDPARWTLLTDHLEQTAGEFEAKVYVDWHDGTLYLMVVSNQPADVHVLLDGRGDGYWRGRDNYELHLTPDEGDPLLWLGVLDCSPAQIDSEGLCRYDSDPLYEAERLVQPHEIGRLFIKVDEDRYVTQIAIPASETTGLQVEHGQEVGLAFHYDFVDGELGRAASTFEPDEIVYLLLSHEDKISFYLPVLAN